MKYARQKKRLVPGSELGLRNLASRRSWVQETLLHLLIRFDFTPLFLPGEEDSLEIVLLLCSCSSCSLTSWFGLRKARNTDARWRKIPNPRVDALMGMFMYPSVVFPDDSSMSFIFYAALSHKLLLCEPINTKLLSDLIPLCIVILSFLFYMLQIDLFEPTFHPV